VAGGGVRSSLSRGLRACRRDAGARGSYDLGSSDRLQDQQKAAGIVFEDRASALFGVEGLQVTGVEPAPDGGIEIWVVTACEAGRTRPERGMVSDRVHERVVTGRGTCAGSATRSTCAGLNSGASAATPAQFGNILDTLDRDRYGQEIAAAWIAKEKLRDVLNLRARITGPVPCQRQVPDRLFTFYDWCAQHDDIPELVTLASTVSRWENEITAAVITGITNATSESLNRLAKLETRLAYGFRSPLNQRRRVRIACTRGYRRRSPSATPKRTHKVTGRQPDPG
jgi:hypothetical protein